MDYNRMAQTTKRLIRENGMQVLLRRQGQGSADYDPSTGGTDAVGADGSFEQPRYLLKLDQPGSQIAQRFGVNRMAETLIDRNEKWAYMDADGDAPKLNDKVIMEGIEFTLLDVQVCGPSGIPVFYQLVMRA